MALAINNGVKNAHQATLKSGVCYPVVQRYFKKSEDIESVHLRSLAGLLISACGMTPDQVLNLPLGYLFDFIPDN